MLYDCMYSIEDIGRFKIPVMMTGCSLSCRAVVVQKREKNPAFRAKQLQKLVEFEERNNLEMIFASYLH